jgi:hypothetical protein
MRWLGGLAGGWATRSSLKWAFFHDTEKSNDRKEKEEAN